MKMKIIEQFIFWFRYNKLFWRIHKVNKSRLGFMDINKECYYEYYIRHIITNKIVYYDGWGSELKQFAIYQVNGQYDAFRKELDRVCNGNKRK